MGRRFGRDRETFLLGMADQVDGTGGGHVEKMHRCAGEAGQCDVAGDHGLLGRSRHARDAEPARPTPLVHGTAGRQAGVLTVLSQRHPEPLGVVEGTPHQRAVLHAGAIVSEERDAQCRQLGQRRQRVAGPSHRDGAGHRHLGHAADAEGEHLGRHPGRVDGRLRVGHGDDGGEAAECSRPGAGLDRLGLLVPGLAQVGVQVDQPGADQAPGGVEHPRARWRVDRPGHRHDVGAGHGDVGPGQSGGSHDGAAADDECGLRQRPAPPPHRGARPRAAGTEWPCAPRCRWPPAG